MKKNVSKKFVISIILLSLCMALMVSCGGGSTEEADKGPDTSFLMGSWFAKTCTQNDVTVDAMDAFGETFGLYFDENGECQMRRGQQFAYVDWTMNDDGTITLTGEDTYQITFPDDSKKTMIMGVRDIDVLLEKYEE